jgi:hypothetical protein
MWTPINKIYNESSVNSTIMHVFSVCVYIYIYIVVIDQQMTFLSVYHSYTEFVKIRWYRSLEDCAKIPIKMLQTIY